MAAALPWIIAGATVASTATSIYAAAKTPKAPTVITDSATQSKESVEAAYAQSESLRKRRGAASTILTGPQGVSGSARETLGT